MSWEIRLSQLSPTEDLLLLATATVKSVKRYLTITELVVVWSVCSVCTSMTKSKPVGPHIQLDALQRFTLFALAVAVLFSLHARVVYTAIPSTVWSV